MVIVLEKGPQERVMLEHLLEAFDTNQIVNL